MTAADVAGATNELFRRLSLDEVREIGRGATCTVYVGRQADLLRMVAVKHFIRPIADDKHQRRFERECQTLAGLQHPNILTLHSTGLDDQARPYILMEYCPNGSLADALAAQGPMSVPDVTRIGIKLSSALQLAHERGVLHRDIKPANVLLTDLREPKLADFGIAGDARELSVTVGDSLTPLYAAPEVLEDGGGSRASDVWSLASTLYALLLGRAPYAATGTTGEGFLALLERIVRDPAPVLERPDVLPGLRQALEAGMEKDPRNRVATARDFAMSLQAAQFAAGMPVTEYLEVSARVGALTADEATRTLPVVEATPIVVTERKDAGPGRHDPAHDYHAGDPAWAAMATAALRPEADPAAFFPSSAVTHRGNGRSWVLGGIAGLIVLGGATAAAATLTTSHSRGGHQTNPSSRDAADGAITASCTGLKCSVDTEGITPVPGAEFHWRVGRAYNSVTPATQAQLNLPSLPQPGSYPVVLTETKAATVVLVARAQITIDAVRRTVAVRRQSSRTLQVSVASASTKCTRGISGYLEADSSSGWRNEHKLHLSSKPAVVRIAHSGRYRVQVPAASITNGVCEAQTSAAVSVRLPSHSTSASPVTTPATPTGSTQSNQPQNPVDPTGGKSSKPKDPVHP